MQPEVRMVTPACFGGFDWVGDGPTHEIPASVLTTREQEQEQVQKCRKQVRLLNPTFWIEESSSPTLRKNRSK